MSSNCYLVARDAKTNDFEMMREFPSLKEADLYTINFHNSKDLAKGVWKSNIVPRQDIDFFIVMLPIGDKNLETREVLYSNSKEIKMMDSEDIKVNALKHFCDKAEKNISGREEIYPVAKNYIQDDDKKEISYEVLRDTVLSFTVDKNKEENDLHRLLLEKKIVKVLDEEYDENQLSFVEEEKEDTEKLVEVLEMFRHFDKTTLVKKDGVVHTANNIYTNNDDLERLDSLLDQRIGFILHDYLNDLDEELNKERELKIIEILSSDKRLLDKTYKYARLITTDIKELVGDNNGYQYRK